MLDPPVPLPDGREVTANAAANATSHLCAVEVAMLERSQMSRCSGWQGLKVLLPAKYEEESALGQAYHSGPCSEVFPIQEPKDADQPNKEKEDDSGFPPPSPL